VPFLVITDPLPPGFYLGPLQIRFYGIAYVVAFIVGTAIATPEYSSLPSVSR